MRPVAFRHAAPAARLGEHMPFHSRSVAEAPASPGVYLLYHLRGEGGACTRCATEFDYETSADPVPLYRHYVEDAAR